MLTLNHALQKFNWMPYTIYINHIKPFWSVDVLNINNNHRFIHTIFMKIQYEKY